MSTPDYELFPLFGYDVAGEPSGPIDPGPPMGPSALQVNGAPAGYNLPADYTGPLLVGSPGGEAPVVLTDPAAIAEYGRARRSRVARGVAAVAALPLMPALSALGPALGGGGTPTRLYWQDPQVNFPRGIPDPRVYVPGTEPPVGTRLPVPYEPPPQPGPFAFGIGGIGAILGGIIAGMWEGWPNALNDDEWLGRIPRQGEQGPPPATQQPIPEEIGVGPLPETTYGPPGEGDPSQIYNPTFPAPRPEQLPPPAGDIVLGPTPEVGPPQPSRAPAPAPAPAPGPALPPWVWPAIGAIGALQIGRAGRSRSSQTLPDISVTTAIDPLTALVDELRARELTGSTSSSSFTQTATGGVWDTAGGDDGCNCSKRSGKKRKCLARAQLTWRSGPKKGRAAGSKCYRFAD